MICDIQQGQGQRRGQDEGRYPEDRHQDGGYADDRYGEDRYGEDRYGEDRYGDDDDDDDEEEVPVTEDNLQVLTVEDLNFIHFWGELFFRCDEYLNIIQFFGK